ncbi:putative gustatory receptor 28b [Prorops nasuta]|uniref:putative gustatory receptor 28b n=1 Tax=Prorops nasuta TaxID=863751 RepID=UPI0034CDBB94
MMFVEWRLFEFLSTFLSVGVNYVIAFFTMTLSTFKRSKALIVWRRMIETDETLEILGAKRDYKKDSRELKYVFFLWLTIISSLFLMDLLNCIRYYGIMESLFMVAAYHLPVYTNSAADVAFGLSLLLIERKFEKLNKLIRQRFQQISPPQLFTIETNKFVTNKSSMVVTVSEPMKNSLHNFVQTSMHLHSELCRITRRINRAFCKLILLEFIISFNQIVASAYAVYFSFRATQTQAINNETKHEPDDISFTILWGLIFAVRVISINHLCGWVVKQAQNTNMIIREIDDIYNTGELKEDLHQFSLQMVLKPLYLSATGFFNIDDNCTQGFFGSVATYVVIFIQMSNVTKALKVLGN